MNRPADEPSARRVAILRPQAGLVETDAPANPAVPPCAPPDASAPIPSKVGRRPRRKMRGSITRKFFLSLFCVLLINMLLTVVFGNTLMKTFYVHNKEAELRSSANLICDALPLEENEPLQQALYTTESSNIEVLVFSVTKHDDGSGDIEVVYSTYSQSTYTEKKRNAIDRINDFVNNGILAICDEQTTYVARQEQSDGGWIRLYRALDGGEYMILETPMQSIVSTSKTAVQFLTLLSVFALVLGGIVSVVLSRRIARPIKQIDAVAQKLTVMDFSRRCEVTSRDEVGTLAANVNLMADRLRENIDLLNQRNELLRRDLEREAVSNSQRRDFIASVSHDFKTPLTLISAYAETLAEGQNEENAAVCGTIVEQAARMNGMVNHLLSLSRLESGMVKLEPTVFALEDVFFTVLTEHRILLEKRGVRVEPVAGSEWFVSADYAQTLQIVTNLVENAIKYADGELALRVSFEQNGDRVRALVYNSADPIEPEVLDQLFNGFYKVDRSRHLQSNSYGLGLAIVKAAVALHGCECGVRNDPGGVTFWFELPAAEMAQDDGDYEDGDEPDAAPPDGSEPPSTTK